MLKPLIDRLQERHLYWHSHLSLFASQFGLNDVIVPICTCDPRWHKWAGVYYQKAEKIKYSLPYLLTEGPDRYDETIAHEMCHHFQTKLYGMKTEKHGEMFHFLLRNVCGFIKSSRYHHYDIRKAKQVEELVILAYKVEFSSASPDITYERKKAAQC